MGSKVTLSSWLQRKKKRESKAKLKVFGNHEEFISRINKTLCYGKLPKTERFSLPVTELAAEIFSKARFPGNGVHWRLHPEGRVLGLERLGVAEAGEISRAACISPCSLVLALIYVDRLSECSPKYLQKISPSKLFVVSMMVASKFLHDDGEDDEVFNDEWAASSGIDETELNAAEREFLTAIDWRVNVQEHQFWEWLEALEEAVALREGHRKGWFTYSDLSYLLHTKELFSIVNTLLTVSAVCLTSYTAGVLTLIGSTMIVSSLPSPSTLLLNSLHHTPLITPKRTQDILNAPLQKDFGNLSESCFVDSIVETTADCSMNMANDLEHHEPYLYGSPAYLKSEENDVLSLVTLSKVRLPEIEPLKSLFNCVNVVSRIFDSLFTGVNLCPRLFSMKSVKQDRLFDISFCVQLFIRNSVIGKNISCNFKIFNHYWSSGASLEEKSVCSLYHKKGSPCLLAAVSIPPSFPFPFETSQY